MLVTLLNNLKVQERQNRVCTTVAIAIVAETCSPFTVLPALMNEYKVRLPNPDPNYVCAHWTPCSLCRCSTLLIKAAVVGMVHALLAACHDRLLLQSALWSSVDCILWRCSSLAFNGPSAGVVRGHDGPADIRPPYLRTA